MTVARGTHRVTGRRTSGGPGWRFTEWLFGIVGGIALFLGLFILFAGENEYVGIGGDWSWRVGDISAAWTYGLLAGGAILLVASLVMVFLGRNRPVYMYPGNKALSDLWWHAGIFTAVNAFIWIQDFAIGGGLDYAYWVTIPWAIGLIVHVAMYLTKRDVADLPPLPPLMEEREEREKELQIH